MGTFLTALLLITAATAWGQLDTLYQEYFTDGQMTLNWFSGWEGGNNMEVDWWEGNPSGDNWVGFVGNDLSGGNVGTALAGDLNMTDYEIHAYLYTTVNTGTYHGIVARWDTTGGFNMFYYLRTDFDNDQRIQLRKYPGESGYGETIAEWSGAQIPGGVPTSDSWHRLGLKVEGNQLWAYYDDQELPGCPYEDTYTSRGFFGVYVFNFLQTTQTTCDDIVILGEAGAQPFDFVPTSNHFLDENFEEMIYRPAENQTVYFSLDWEALNGFATSSPFDIVLEMDDTPIFQTTNPGVEPNSSHTTQSDAWTATLGEHTLRWTLDARDQVAEQNEDNNVLEETFLVLPENAYDFSADSTWITDLDTIPITTGEVPDDEDVLFVLHWSVPMGSGTVSAFNIRLDVDGEEYFLTTIPFVQSGETYMTVSDPWTPAELGFHYFEWFIDPDNWVDEFAEWNNSTLDGFDVVEAPGVKWDAHNAGGVAESFRISGVFPNPFNPTVTLRYENAGPGILKLTVYDVAGREVAVLADGFHPSGVWEVTWSGEEIAAGTYFAVLEGNGKRDVQPLMLVK